MSTTSFQLSNGNYELTSHRQVIAIIGKNIYEKRILAAIAVLIFVGGGAITAYGVQALGNSHSGALVSSNGINSDIGQVWGINNTAKNPTYEAATLTTGTNYVTATFAAGFNVSHIVVFDKNPTYDVQGILNSSLYYSQLNVEIETASGVHTNLSSVTEMFGVQTNDTSIHNINDKAISAQNMYSYITVYNSGTNLLNKSEQFSTFGLGAGDYSNLYGISINLNGTGVNSTGALAVKIYQTFGAPFNMNLVNIFGDVFVVEALLATVMMGLGLPRIKGGR